MTLDELTALAAKNPAHDVHSAEIIGEGESARFEFIEAPKNCRLVHDPVMIDTGYVCILEDLDYVAPE